MKKCVFSTIALAVCLFVMSSAAFGQQQQQHRPKRSGGLDNLSLPSTGAAIASSSWRTVAPAGAGFSIMMPGLPDEMSKEMGTSGTNLREYRVKADGTDYVVGVLLDFPRELLQQPNFTEQYLNLLPSGMIRSAEYASKNYKLVSQRAITINDYSGRQYKFDSPDYTCTMRVYVAENSIYVIAVESQKATLSVEKVEKFLSSFMLKEN